MDLLKRYIPVLLLLAVLVSVQVATQLSDTSYYLTQLTMSAYYCIVVIGLCVLMGYGGQISLGHAGFFAIGGYLAAAFTTHDLTPFRDNGLVAFLDKAGLLVASTDLYGGDLLTVEPWAACLTAVFVAGIIAFSIGGPILKLKGHYLAMATLGFGIIIYRIALASAYFGEADGISEVPGFRLLPGIEVSGSFGARVMNYYIAWGMLVIGVILLFVTHYNGGIGPSEAGVMKSVRYVAIVAVGGMANIWGALIMGIVLNFLSLRGVFGSYDDAVFGVILIVIMLFAPEGILKINPWQRVKSLFVLAAGRDTEGPAEN
jgi:branched-chain amino acid transport system permease protein